MIPRLWRRLVCVDLIYSFFEAFSLSPDIDCFSDLLLFLFIPLVLALSSKMDDAEHRHGHLDESAIPGTVHLVDLEGTIRAKHASGTQLKDVVLVPTPSSDPDDPLNWSPKRKWLSTASQSMYTLMVGIASAAIYSVLEPISKDTGLTLGDLNSGTGYMFLFFGWGCLFWQAIALQYGKRPVYLFSMLATLVGELPI